MADGCTDDCGRGWTLTAIDAGDPTTTEIVMDRADIFRAAYKLVFSLEWDRSPDVMDVTRVAEFLDVE